MKKFLLAALALAAGPFCWGQEVTLDAGKPAECSLPPEAARAPEIKKEADAKPLPVFASRKEAKKAFKERRKRIAKLVKQYRKASSEEKPAVKEKLYALVSESMDLGLAGMKERIAQQRANLDRWAGKLAEEESRWEEVKAQRVEDLLSGAAERKHKLAKKAWKREIKESKRVLR